MFNFKKNKDEYYHMNMFAFEIKEAWRSSMTDVEGFIKARKYLNKAKLNKDDHPFLWEFRKKINLIDINSSTVREEVQESLKEFYRKKGILYQMKKHNISVVY